MNDNKRIISKKWGITIAVICIIGILINIYILIYHINESNSAYNTYLEFERMTNNGYDLAHEVDRYYCLYQLYHIIIILAIIMLLTLFSILFFAKFRAITFSVFGLCALFISIGYVIVLTKADKNQVTAVALVFFTLISMSLMIIGVWLKMASLTWAALGLFSAASVYGIIATQEDEFAIYLLELLGIILLAAFHVQGMKAVKKTFRADNYTQSMQQFQLTQPMQPMQQMYPMQQIQQVQPMQQMYPTQQIQQMQPVQQIYPQADVNIASANFSSGESLFSSDYILIDQKVRAFAFGSAYGLYSGNGNLIGSVVQGDISGGAKAAQVMLGRSMRAMQSVRFSIYDAYNQYVGGLSRKGMGLIDFDDSAGNLIGTLKRGNLVTPYGQVIASLKVAGLTTKNILDETGQVVACFQKKWNGAKEVFTNADKYLVSFAPGLDENKRIIALSMCIAIDFLVSG